MDIQIKQITPSKAKSNKDRIITFIYESVTMCSFQEEYNEMQAEEKYEELYKYIQQEKAIVLGAFDNEQMVGFLWAYGYPFREDTNRLYISIVHVEEEYRNQHIGEKMLKQIERIATEKKYDAIFLHAEAKNEKACRFYERMDYVKERIQFVKCAVSETVQETEQLIWGRVLEGTPETIDQYKKQFVDLYYQNIQAHSYVERFSLYEAEQKIEEFKEYLEQGKAFLFYMLSGEKIVGFIWIHPIIYHNQNRYYIHAVITSPEFRGKGIASQIYHFVSERFRGDTLYTHVDVVNTVSCNLHRKLFQEEAYQYMKKVKPMTV